MTNIIRSILLAVLVAGILCTSGLAVDEPVPEEDIPQETVQASESQTAAPGDLQTASVYRYSTDLGNAYTWRYEWLPNGFMAFCEETGDCPVVMLEKGTYTYCPENIPETFPWIEDALWGEMESFGIAPYATVYRVKGSSDDWQYGFPSTPGSYQVALALFPGVETTTPYWGLLGLAGHTTATVVITHSSSDTWTAEGCDLVTRCSDGGEILARVSLSGDVTEYLCEENPDSYISTWFLDHNAETIAGPTMPEIVTLYQGTGSTKYTLSTTKPTTAGTYEMYLAVLSDPAKPKSATLKTEPQTLIILEHEWSYDTNEYSLHAACGLCGATASVTIDTSTVYEASRNYKGDELDYEVSYEEGWSSQAGIEPYYVLFSGKQTGETSSTVYDRAFVKPTATGSYNVRLALLEDPDDPETAWLSTKEKPYYLADIGIGDCQITSYGSEQITQFTEPDMNDGFYQVGTLSELLWCLYNKNLTANIELTNDIVVNPITVNEKGEVRCGSYQVYTWDGFGTDDKPFTGNIVGYGYTIYGIYQPSSTPKRSGLMDYCRDSQIVDLTVENAVFYGNDVGAIAGHYDCTSYSDAITDCQALNCYLCAKNTAGAMVGWLTSSSGSDLTIRFCSNDSIICGEGQYGAGGILGKAEGIDTLQLQNCYNLGDISSTKGYAGGILGQGNLGTTEAYVAIFDCFNTGSVNCPNYAGGIAGYLVDYKDNMHLYFDNCTSVGYLYASKNLGGITGYIDTDYMYYLRALLLGNYFYNASVGFNGGNESVLQHATKLTRAQVNGGFICTKYGHTACSHWTAVSSPSCTRDGELQLTCAVCDAVMESETIAAHGHRYEYGQCIFCGAYEDDDDSELEGSLFGTVPGLAIAGAAGALVLLAGGWFLIKHKKH